MVQQPEAENQGLLDITAVRKTPFQHWLLVLQLATLGLCFAGFGGLSWILSARITSLQQASASASSAHAPQQFPSLVGIRCKRGCDMWGRL